jgi:outer membrane protein TolC
MKKNIKITTSIILSLFIVGCTVQPKVMTKQEIQSDVKENLAYLNANSAPVTAPISLNEAIDRAIDYNLQKKVSIMESALSKEQIELVTYDSLPSLTANAGYSVRNNYSASASTSFTNGQPDELDSNPSYSVSQSKEKRSADIGFSWNILDFGLSYIRAKQQSDKYLIAKAKEQKVINNITQSVRSSYYKALSADELMEKIVPVMIEIRKAIKMSKQAKELQVDSTMKTLTYQRELYDIFRSLSSIRKSLISAKTELSELMGLKPGTKFSLVKMEKDDYAIPILPLTLAQMEKIAIEHRPEIQESRYKQRISEEEITAVKLSMLPRFGISSSIYYDDSKYLLNSNWYSYGATVSWNLFDIFTNAKKQEFAKSKVNIAKQQKLAIYMAVLSQVHLAYVNFKQTQSDYMLSREYLEVADEIFSIIKSRNELSLNSDLLLIKEKLNYILATLRHSSSYAQMQNSYGQMLVSIGDLKAFDKADKSNIIKENLPQISLIDEDIDQTIDNTLEDSIKEDTPKVADNIDNKNDIPTVEVAKKVLNEDVYKMPKVVAITKVRSKVRSQPSTKSAYVMVLDAGSEVVILEKAYSPDSGFWYKTKQGYMHSKVLEGHRKVQW